MTESVYIAIFENEKWIVKIEYLPLQKDGLIEIVSIDVQARPETPIQEREKSRK